MNISSIMHTAILSLVMIALCIVVLPVFSQDFDDPYLWLEEIEGEEALNWVEERNRETKGKLSSHRVFDPIRERILNILNNELAEDESEILFGTK